MLVLFIINFIAVFFWVKFLSERIFRYRYMFKTYYSTLKCFELSMYICLVWICVQKWTNSMTKCSFSQVQQTYASFQQVLAALPSAMAHGHTTFITGIQQPSKFSLTAYFVSLHRHIGERKTSILSWPAYLHLRLLINWPSLYGKS